jgi:hypothetical protein
MVMAERPIAAKGLPNLAELKVVPGRTPLRTNCDGENDATSGTGMKKWDIEANG